MTIAVLWRRLRGVLGIGLAWGLIWAAIFATLSAVVGAVRPQVIDAGEGPLDVWPVGAMVGLVSGIAFGILLGLAENHRAIPAIPPGRAALWGIVGSAVFPLLTGRPDQVFVLCPIGAVLALASILIARKAAPRDPGRPRRALEIVAGYAGTSIGDAVDAPIGRSA
jgi:hypothetical protein